MTRFDETLRALARGQYGAGRPARPARMVQQYPDPAEVTEEMNSPQSVPEPSRPRPAAVAQEQGHAAPRTPRAHLAPDVTETQTNAARPDATPMPFVAHNVKAMDENPAPVASPVPQQATASDVRANGEASPTSPDDGPPSLALGPDVSDRFPTYGEARAMPLILSHLAETEAAQINTDAPETPANPEANTVTGETTVVSHINAPPPPERSDATSPLPKFEPPQPDLMSPPPTTVPALEIGELSISVAPPAPAPAPVRPSRHAGGISASAAIRRAGIRRL